MKTKLSVFCNKIIEAGWLAAVVAVPLYFNIYSARTFEPDKIALLRAIVSLMVLAWIVMIVEQGFNLSENGSPSPVARLRGWLKMPLFLPTLLLVIIYIISTIFSISPQVSLWGSYQRLQGTYTALSYMVVFALIAGNLRTREQADRLVTTIIITSVPISLYGIIQRYGLDPLPWAGDVTQRVAANLGNAIFVASYLIMVSPLTVVRLVESITAIVKDEKVSWGHTILAAVYIFALAVQIITVLFSGSRGPLLGILGASFVMGLLIVLILRHLHTDPSHLSFKEIGLGFAFIIPLGLATGLGGGIGYLLGLGFEQIALILNYQPDNFPLLGAAIGGLIGLFGLYTYMAASGKGWRWQWVNWLATAVLAIGVVLALNIPGTSLDPYLQPIRQLPYINSLSRITIADSGTGKVRVLIWDAAMELMKVHQPLGIAGDSLSGQDPFNLIRPLIGYGPESMFNAFAFVYPPELAHVEARGSSADRSHNETMDSLVITGVLGFAAFYLVMFSLFYYTLHWLGWVPDQAARWRLIILLIVCGLIGAITPYLAAGSFTFTPVGLPFGLITGVVIHLTWQGIIQQKRDTENTGEFSTYHLLLIGLLGAIIGHFIEVHFVFSIAATYTYFWVYAGLIVALSRIKGLEMVKTAEPVSGEELATTEQTVELEAPTAGSRRSKKGRERRRGGKKQATALVGLITKRESWEMWVGSQGLAMAIILMILAFDFMTPRYQFSFDNEKNTSLLWLLLVTWLVGLAITLSSQAIRQHDKKVQMDLAQGALAALLYIFTSLSYFILYIIIHLAQLDQQIAITSIDDVIRAADVLSNGLVIFYFALFLLMAVLAITLAWGQPRSLTFWQVENWWLYPPLVLAISLAIWFKNINVVRADIYLKEGERYRNNQQWAEAIAVHEKARSLDSDEDFYYLMLALDYQLMAQDTRLETPQRETAWRQGEQIALEARRINPYNPDNTGNMGRYYFTLGQLFDPSRYQDALAFFEKATTLAPSNVVYHNLWGQTLYLLQDYEGAIDRLQTSVSIDPNYAPSWLLLGDTYAAVSKVDQALMAHSEAMKLNSPGSGDGFAGFADQFIEQRLNFYISAGRGDDLITVLQQVALARPQDARVPRVIGRAYNLMGQPEQAVTYLEQAVTLGDNSDGTIKELANLYLSLNSLDQAVSLFQLLLERNPNDIEGHSALAFIYAQQGHLEEAIQHNQQVLQQAPNDYDSLKNLAILYQQTGKLQESFDAAQKAQAAAPESEQGTWEKFITDLQSQLTPGS
jgi:tetratricopeptide (TPR) repeat protein